MNPFDQMYENVPPWDIGRPQRPFVDLQKAGLIKGRVLDAGCGTGDLALFCAQLGHEVVGVDLATNAVASARRKAVEKKLKARFEVADALELEVLKTAFDTVLDCGMLHTFNDRGRDFYRRSLERVLKVGGTFHVMCFSDAEPDWGGPRRIEKDELAEIFTGGWFAEDIRAVRFENRMNPDGAAAWLGTFSWMGKPAAGVN